ncbi:hypothetical protein [Microbacterium sp. CFBP9034]|uniref:hypothetical protein n=1 Tax=Microbacterium sp. CFBP9034 TaxID=3096540 RepID=UPI002A6A4697|nr:hypothetical protein [Microbacterium sp. CFBP9034]MDY0910092.1 hypothetical protein [Microbacterium sp. CFBP9034]
MTDSERPALLREATAAVAYAQWLAENGLEDSDVNAWRFAAEVGASSETRLPAPAGAATLTNERRRTVRWWIPVTIALSAVAIVVGILVFAIATAQTWTKIDRGEVSRTVQVSDGTWHVTHDNKDVCYVGQNYWDCIDEYTDEWDFACAGRAHDESSRELCEQYYDLIQEMKNDASREEYSEVSGLVESGRLSIRENTKNERVVDVPERSHEAVCYLGFIGECPSER